MGELTLSLSDPGFGYLERLGVAAAALALDAAAKEGADLGPLQGSFDRRDVRLSWPDDARDEDALMPLFDYAWQAKDGRIQDGLGVLYFPAVHRGSAADDGLQRYVEHTGVLRTFLQHARIQPKTKPEQFQHDLGDDHVVRLQIVEPKGKLVYREEARTELFKKGRLVDGRLEFSSFLVPGATSRYSTEPSWSGSLRQAFALLLAPTAAYYLSLGAKGWVIVVPDVSDLLGFVRLRPRAGIDYESHRAGSAADAGLATLVRLKLSHALVGLDAVQARPTRCEVVHVGGVIWNKQNVRRMRLELVPGQAELEHFEAVARWLPNRYQKRKDDDGGFIRVPSPRGVIAANLGAGRPWFYRLFDVPRDERDNLESQRKKLGKNGEGKSVERLWFHELSRFYRKELNGIMNDVPMQTADEAFVGAFHQALRRLYGKEADAAKRGSRSASERLEDLTEEIRRRIERSQTRSLLRETIASLFARAGRTESLQQHRSEIWSLIDSERDWARARDLSLLALASYQRTPTEGEEEDAAASVTDDTEAD